jgi:L-fucose isomerase-like protein
VDWNNNYGGDPDRCVLFHCGNWAKGLTPDAEIGTMPIHELALGEGCSWGTMAGRVPAGPMSYARVSTDDAAGRIRAYVGDAAFTDDPLDTFGNRAVARVPGLQKLLHHICRNGFEHHAAVSASHSAEVLAEAFQTYLGWEVYHHVG